MHAVELKPEHQGAQQVLQQLTVMERSKETRGRARDQGRTRPGLITAENARAGTRDWKLSSPAVRREIEGYASLTSVNRGGEIEFFVHTAEPSYTIEIYRMGWYGGLGGRLVAPAFTRPGLAQKMPEMDPKTGLNDCDWQDPYRLKLEVDSGEPLSWLSGVYLAKLTAGASGKQSYIIFVVREDERASDLLFQSSVTTFQAYNKWGGKSLYDWQSTDGRRAFKVSFNRPYGLGDNPSSAIGLGAGDFLTNTQKADHTPPAGWEYPMVRWLEREGYDVTYVTNIDIHQDSLMTTRLLKHKGFLSVGHDEYWSAAMRNHVEQARDAGINLGFFSANTCYWQVRFEPSSGAGRIMVCYKNWTLDPIQDNTCTDPWRYPKLNRPESSLLGVMFVEEPVNADVIVDAADHWVFAGTGLKKGDSIPQLIGYEADMIHGGLLKNQVRLAHSPCVVSYPDPTQPDLIYPHTIYSNMSIYTASSGALVFATGSMQWSWGLDDVFVPALRTSRRSEAAIRITRNVLNRMVAAR